ncbi:MAG: hypothetical protein JST62_14520 [Bacteroidetes bacterium]|jgi:nitrogen regulatory protein PII|nr:hypothetical protein [Bacteroidota bacterium]
MKLILITAIDEYEKDIKNILKHSGIKTFTVQSVQGYQNNEENDLSSWFVSDSIATDSILFTVFAKKECVEKINERVVNFNQTQTLDTKIHLATIDIENSI